MGIESVVYQKASERGGHSDERRTLRPVFNGEDIFKGFTAAQLKVAEINPIPKNLSYWIGKIIGKKTPNGFTLGAHYHPDYRELFTMATGEARFTLEDADTKARQVVSLAVGDVLMIPPRVAHKAFVTPNSILLGCTEKPYVSAAINDVKYEIKD